jgi:hypothetical protein
MPVILHFAGGALSPPSPLLAQLTRDSETRSLGSSTLKRDGALL